MKPDPSSFRDPDGYIFEFNGDIYRAVNHSYRHNLEHLISSGLYKKLVERGLLLPFIEVDPLQFELNEVYKVLKPERIHLISYPYEWSFSMLKDAALLTLEIQTMALLEGMSLKDSSAYNIQFQNGKPVFIDTLSFELFSSEKPWIAYRQFCEHFLAPLSLMAKVDARLNRMLIIHMDGIPLDETSKMLPFASRFNLGIYFHILLHSRMQKKHQNDLNRVANSKRKFSLRAMQALIEGLRSTVNNLRWRPHGTEWSDYTDEDVHKREYTRFKKRIISELLELNKPSNIWDLGSNNGVYSRIAAAKGINVVSLDMDPVCVDMNYELVKKNLESNIHPLLMDVLNFSPSIGWRGTERISFLQRSKPDLIMALALIHHLAISANISLDSIASYFAQLSDSLIIEFVPKDDEKVKLLLLNREDIFPAYTQENFERTFLLHYTIYKKIPSDCNSRTFYMLKRK